MNQQAFMNKMVAEYRRLTFMSSVISKNKLNRFHHYFYRKARIHLHWSRKTFEKEWIKFTNAFKIKVDDNT